MRHITATSFCTTVRCTTILCMTVLTAAILCTTAARGDVADTIYTGGDILTMAGAEPQYVESLAVKDGRILFVGTDAEAVTPVRRPARSIWPAGPCCPASSTPTATSSTSARTSSTPTSLARPTSRTSSPG
jgi:hypothetical protein